jgi:catalase
VQKHIAHCTQADPAYGKGVADAIARQKAGTL